MESLPILLITKEKKNMKTFLYDFFPNHILSVLFFSASSFLGGHGRPLKTYFQLFKNVP